MSRPDSTAATALDAPIIRPIWFAWLDIVGDVVRCNSSGHDITITAESDAELNGVYIGIDHSLVSVSSVKIGETGTDTVTASLSGLPGVDAVTLAQIADPANYRGRLARFWRVIRAGDGSQQGGFQPYYTGYMTRITLAGSSEKQVIEVSIESYLAALSKPSNRTYLDQELFDAGDLSARAAIAIANGTNQGNATPTYDGGGGSYGGRGDVRNL